MVRCGRGHYHETATDVRACYNGERVADVTPTDAVPTKDRPTERQLGYVKNLLNQAKLGYTPGLATLDKRSVSVVIGQLRAGATEDSNDFADVESPLYCERGNCDNPGAWRIAFGYREHTKVVCQSHKAAAERDSIAYPETFLATPLTDVARHDRIAADSLTVRRTTPSAPKPAPFDPETLEDGFYVSGDDVYKVIVAVHGSGRKYAKKLDKTTGEWEMAPGAVRTLRPEQRMTLSQAIEVAKVVATDVEGRLYGRCFVCGRPLTAEDSIERFMGPVCAGKFG